MTSQIPKLNLTQTDHHRMVRATLPRGLYSRGDDLPQDILMRTDEEGRWYQHESTTDTGIEVRVGWWFKCILLAHNCHCLVHEDDLGIDVREIVGDNPPPKAEVEPRKEIPVKATRKSNRVEEGVVNTPNPNYRELLKEAALKDPSGVTILARQVGCSVLTARKHLDRMVEDGELQCWVGGRGKLYGATNEASTDAIVERMSEPRKLERGHKMVAQGKFGDRRVRMRVKVTKSTKTGSKVMVRTADGKELVMAWDPNSGGYAVNTGEGRLVARP